jgi:hypothetical protein
VRRERGIVEVALGRRVLLTLERFLTQMRFNDIQVDILPASSSLEGRERETITESTSELSRSMDRQLSSRRARPAFVPRTDLCSFRSFQELIDLGLSFCRVSFVRASLIPVPRDSFPLVDS